MNASYHKSENRKTRFAIMASRATGLRGLFENVENEMPAVHSFDLGELVTVFQMSPAKGLMIEGQARIVNLADADEYYEVRFQSDLADYASVDDCPTYQRFIDREGQADPEAYRREFNKRISKAA